MSSKLNKLHENCIKSKNRIWSENLIEEKTRKLEKIILGNSSLKDSPKVLEIRKILESQKEYHSVHKETSDHDDELTDLESDSESDTMSEQMRNLPKCPWLKDNFDLYRISFELWFAMSGHKEEQKPYLFLMCMGEKGQKILQNIKTVEGKSYTQIVKLSKDIFEPALNAKQLFVKFFNLKQESEDIESYVDRLKCVADSLEMKYTEAAFMGKFIHGLQSDYIKTELQKAKELTTFEECYKQALNIQGIKREQVSVNKVNKAEYEKRGIFRNSDKGKQSKNKQPRDKSKVECFHCKKLGHYKNECRKWKKDNEGKKANQVTNMNEAEELSIGSINVNPY